MSRFSRFWQEIKRRKVFNVIAPYAATSYIVIEVTNNLVDSLQLPPWIATLVVLMIVAGLPVAIIVSWIFDFTPQGLRKTESIEEVQKKEIPPRPLKRRLKLSYVLNGVLFIAVIVLASREVFRKDPIDRLRSSDKKISVSVMPFRNLTKDTVLSNWQEWIQNDIISFLSETGELEVRDQQATNDVLRTGGITEFASLSPDLAGIFSKKLGTDIYIKGTLQKAGPIIKVVSQISDAKTKKVIKPFEITLPYNDTVVLIITDSLRKRINDFLLLTKLLKENPDYQSNLTRSPEALKYFIMGDNSSKKGDTRSAYEFYSNALKIDSNFFWAAFRIERNCPVEERWYWLTRNYKIRDRMPLYERLFASWAYAWSFESPEERLKYMLQIREVVGPTRVALYNLAAAYLQTVQPLKVIEVFEEYMKVIRRMGKEYRVTKDVYEHLAGAYSKTGRPKKAYRISKSGARNFPDEPNFIYLQAGYLFKMNKPVKAERRFKKYIIKASETMEKKNLKYTESNMYEDKGWFFNVFRQMKDSACFYYWKALEMQGPEYNYGDINRITMGLMQVGGARKDLDKFLKYMDILIESAKNNKYTRYEYLSRKGRAFLVNGRYQDALEIFQKVYDESPYKLYYMKKNLEDVNTKLLGEEGREITN